MDQIISDSTLCIVGQEAHAHRILHPDTLCSCRMAGNGTTRKDGPREIS